MNETRLVVEGLGFPESTRWRDGRVWLCNWGAGEVLAVTTDGKRQVVARLTPPALPFSIDWLPDGRLLVIDGPRRRLLRQAKSSAGSMVTKSIGYPRGAASERAAAHVATLGIRRKLRSGVWSSLEMAAVRHQDVTMSQPPKNNRRPRIDNGQR
jgi:hypothetical protein